MSALILQLIHFWSVGVSEFSDYVWYGGMVDVVIAGRHNMNIVLRDRHRLYRAQRMYRHQFLYKAYGSHIGSIYVLRSIYGW